MKIDCHLDYATIVRGRSEFVHLAIAFEATKQTTERAMPFAFGLVLDNSGSMGGLPLQHAKAAAKMVVTHLRSVDQIALAIFSDTARTVIPLQPAADKARLHRLIDAIEAEGSTNLTAGWMLGRDEVAKAPADMPRKVLLLTDGQLNVGIVSPPQVRQIVGSGLEKERVRTSCLGFGDGYNEDLLDALAKAAGGTLHDADSPEKLPGIFQQELESLLKLSAQNIRVRVRKLHYCSGVAVVSDYPVVALPAGGIEIAVGDLVSEEQRVLVLALEVLPIPPLADGAPAASLEGEALLEVEFAFDEITDDAVASRTETRTIRVVPVQSVADVQVNETVVQWVAEQTAGRAISDAIQERDRGDAAAVERRIRETKQRLSRYGSTKTQRASESLDQFMEQSREDWNSRSRKSLRSFSSRSMKMSSVYLTDSVDPVQWETLRELYAEVRQRGSLAADYFSLGGTDLLRPIRGDDASILERGRGCLLGGAVGDALGRVREGRPPGGEWIEEYPAARAGELRGTVTDDTQFTMWLAESLIRERGVEPHALAHRFVVESIRGIGQATLAFVTNVKVAHKTWHESGVRSAGNGVAMRSSPIGLYYRGHFDSLKLGSILQAIVTHNDGMAVASGFITAFAVALLLRLQPEALETLEARRAFCRRVAAAVRGMEAGGNYLTRDTGEPMTLERRFAEDLPRWLAEGLDPLEVSERHGSGAYVLESLPLAFYCFLRTPGDFRETLLQAVNASRDSDTVAAIACNLSGALNGVSAIPATYLDGLEFRAELDVLAERLMRKA